MFVCEYCRAETKYSGIYLFLVEVIRFCSSLVCLDLFGSAQGRLDGWLNCGDGFSWCHICGIDSSRFNRV